MNEELIEVLKELQKVPVNVDLGKDNKKSDFPSPTILKYSKAERYDG